MAAEQEKIELSEQTPLKVADSSDDTIAAAAQGAAPAVADESATKTTNVNKKKKALAIFSFGKSVKADAPTTTDETAHAKGGDGDGAESSAVESISTKKEKKQHWWSVCNQKCQQNNKTDSGHKQPQISYGINLIQRDDCGLQSAIDLTYEDIYGEPDAAHSIGLVWRTNYIVFDAVRSFFYKLFSLIIAIPLSVVFGILFALFSVLSVYLFVPFGKLLAIPLNWIFKMWNYVISSVFDPIFYAFGQCFSNVKISRYGINSDPTQVITA